MDLQRVLWILCLSVSFISIVKCRRTYSSHLQDSPGYWGRQHNKDETTTEISTEFKSSWKSPDWSTAKADNSSWDDTSHRRQSGSRTYSRHRTSSGRETKGGYSSSYYSRNRTDSSGPTSTYVRYSETRLKNSDPQNVSSSYGVSSRRKYSRFDEHRTSVSSASGGALVSSTVNRAEYSNTSYWHTDDAHPLSQFDVYSQRGSSPLGCEESSCYPATGNILIGRENKLWSSSTCGQSKQERYCIVSHLKERKKCFFCDSRPHQKNNLRLYHGIENIVSRIGKKRIAWWQSENGVENVTIGLDLDAEFHFTHLIITFKTFRPSAMVIERSPDFGKTWKVYQYFAYNCEESFPNVSTGPRNEISDVICDSHYSGVEPSTDGEVIFRVLLPNIPVPEPTSIAVQEVLKMTNLRIHFRKLHTLGDNLLDSRLEIKEKYYYAIYDMVVRGSCSCYGHASNCIANREEHINHPDMIHGKCECKHNTVGNNCEKCEDLYNDLEWQPAIGRNTNACKRCNCNNHATKCHFDASVYASSGRMSGGVCDECMHNTTGTHCETCVPFFYQDPSRDLRDPGICQPCDCDPRGSLDEGECEPKTDIATGHEAGNCHCKNNVEGRRCDRCKNGFWNFQTENPDGCEACSCNQYGTIGNRGCNVYNGECVCKRNVVGRDCNQCLPEYWGLDTSDEGCKTCDCDPGGAYDNNCDVISGQCRCRPHVSGRKCDQPEAGFYVGAIDFMVYEAELAKGNQGAQVVVREPYPDRDTTWTGLGFMRVFEATSLEFDITDVPMSLDYDIVLRYEPQLPGRWENVRITLERPGPVDPYSICARAQDSTKTVTLNSGERFATVQPSFCLEKGKNYKVRIEFHNYDREVDTPSASILIDAIAIIPRVDALPFYKGSQINNYRRQEYERFRCGEAYFSAIHPDAAEICKKHLYSIGFYVYGQAHECSCDPTGSLSINCDILGGQCTCKQNVVGRRCERCAPGTYGFGPSGCRPCDCNSIGSLDNFCDQVTGQCKCRPNTYGLQCDECQPGFWSYPNCERCDCNSHADKCDPHTGFCEDCRDSTAGPKCDHCVGGYYGDPRLGLDIPCRPCSCPGTLESGISHASSCELEPRTQNVVCSCEFGYSGERCDRCSNNYYGEPTIPGGECKRCECNNNIDERVSGNCDAKSGECLQCLNNTYGFHCEQCSPGFYGEAGRQQCIRCSCNILGTDPNAGSCNHQTGQCPCLPNVVGRNCDHCEHNHWKIASGQGCEACDCDPVGSFSTECNEFDGQCHCRQGHGGRKCDQCEDYYWGDPKVQCHACDCDKEGSITQQCHRNNGSCVCIEGLAGHRCDRCARGFSGVPPHCDSCGECFNSWDSIIQELKENTQELLDAARRIKQTGTTGAYNAEFTEMEDKLQQVQEILQSANVTSDNITALEDLVRQVKDNLTLSESRLKLVQDELAETNTRTAGVDASLSTLRSKANNLTIQAQEFKNNATALQEANVEGAFNITKEAQLRSRLAERKVEDTEKILQDSASERRKTERLLLRANDRFSSAYRNHANILNTTLDKIEELKEMIPDINNLVCDGRGTVDECDILCGGAGCDKCGDVSCTQGSLTRAKNALKISEDAEDILSKKQTEVQTLLTDVEEANKNAKEALEEAKHAYESAQRAKDKSDNFTGEIEMLQDKIDEFLLSDKAKPAEIRTLANEVLKLSISLEPNQITELASQINSTIDSLTNIDAIIAETADDLRKAEELKQQADLAKDKADKTLNTAKTVQDALGEARSAQIGAQLAIDKAKVDIKAAQDDLEQIATETQAAQKVANDSVDDVVKLQKRLDELKRQYTENTINHNNAAKEASIANEVADKVQQKGNLLEEKYKEADKALVEKAEVSGAANSRAEKLRARAKKLAEDANGHLSILQDMEREFDDNEQKLKDYSDILDRLNREMAEHLAVIESRSSYYRECQGSN